MYSVFVLLAICGSAIAASINGPDSNNIPSTLNYPDGNQKPNNKAVVNLAAIVFFAQAGKTFSDEDMKAYITPSRVERAVSDIPTSIKIRQTEKPVQKPPIYVDNGLPLVPVIEPPPRLIQLAESVFKSGADLFG